MIKENMKKIKMQNRNVLIFMFAFLVSSCLNETAVPIKSAFTIEASEDKTSPVTIQLKNESYGADELLWIPGGMTLGGFSEAIIEKKKVKNANIYTTQIIIQ